MQRALTSRTEHNDNPFSSHSWRYDGVVRLLEQDGTLPLETNPL
ncbi:hypothetical protein [Mixta intestinalis]|nr:hypothetical protein [Mixta intestinalis]